MVARLAQRAESFIEARLRRDEPPVLEPYRGYAEPGALVLRGRVLSGLRRRDPVPESSRWANFRQMVGLFLTSEVAGVTVRAGGHTAQSDDEGYVTLRLPRDGVAPGWAAPLAEIAQAAHEPRAMPVLVPRNDARFGVISDIDDTMMHTGAHSLLRNLWTTFTGSALSRRVFPDAVALIDRLSAGGRNPVFYVSSSPWNLSHFLESVFHRAGLVPGPMFLRELGVRDGGAIGASHLDHKGAAIDLVLAANPDLGFVLLGDTGQMDAFVYRDAVRRHPGRIRAVILREPVKGSARSSLAALLEIEAMGVPTHYARSFADLPPRVLPEGKDSATQTAAAQKGA